MAVKSNAKLGSAIENACKKLPQEYEINIYLERGSAVVELYDIDGNICDFPTNGDSLSESIDDAVEYATSKGESDERNSN
jgi:hypothetical protein